MTFRDRLVASLRALRPVLEVDGVLVIGSEVPNLLEPGGAATLVVSLDVDVGIPVTRHAEVKRALATVTGLAPSPEEPSVWLPVRDDLIEVNFVGVDPTLADAADTYVLSDDTLPLLVFGHLALLRPGRVVEVDGVRVPLPRPAGVMLEKLLTDRTGEKGDRDLLVVLGVLLHAGDDDLAELEEQFRLLVAEQRHAVRSSLTVLSLLQPHPSMPDPVRHRHLVAALLHRLDETADDGD